MEAVPRLEPRPRDESAINREIHQTEQCIQTALSRVSEAATKVALRAENFKSDHKNRRAVWHGNVQIEEILAAGEGIAALETRLTELRKELGGLR